MGDRVGAIPWRGGLAPRGGPGGRTVRTEGKGRRSRLAGRTGRGGGRGGARHRRRAPEACTGSRATFIEATGVEEEKKEEKNGRKT